MIPGKDTQVGKSETQKERYGSFALFDIEHFLRRYLKTGIGLFYVAYWLRHFLGVQ
jgi:hypothetical protein